MGISGVIPQRTPQGQQAVAEVKESLSFCTMLVVMMPGYSKDQQRQHRRSDGKHCKHGA
jgi:hypothetical protein